jgi:hypothetical protein
MKTEVMKLSVMKRSYLMALCAAVFAIPLLFDARTGLVLVLVFPLIYVVTEFIARPWRDGIVASAVAIGTYLLVGLWCQDWVPGYDNTSTLALVFNGGGVLLLLFWAWLIDSGPAAARRAVAFVLPVVMLALVWITYKGHGGRILSSLWP